MELFFSPPLINFYTLYLNCFWSSSWLLTSKHLFTWSFSFMKSMHSFQYRTFRKMLMYKRSFFYKHLLCSSLCQAIHRILDQRWEDPLCPSGVHGLGRWEIPGLMQGSEWYLRRSYFAIRENLEKQMGIHGNSRLLLVYLPGPSSMWFFFEDSQNLYSKCIKLYS